MSTPERVRLVALMVSAGACGALILVRLVVDATQRGVFDGGQFTQFISFAVVFWLAAECYGLRLERRVLRDENTLLRTTAESRAAGWEEGR